MNKKIIYSLLLLLSMSSCMKDELDGIADANNGRGTRIYVEALSHTVVETRAATSENAINDLSILVFDASDKLTEYVEASILSNGEIYATLKHATEQRKLLIMANVKAIVNKAKVADPNVFATGATLASIQDKLLLDAAMIIKDPTTGSNITTMPMLSAIITEAKIDEDTPLGTTTAPLQLTHRLTKISAESSVTDMQIESITLRQAPANGGRLLDHNTTPEIAERINYFGADDVATPMMPTSNQPLYMFSSKNTGSTVTKPVEMIVKARYGSDAVATYYHIRLDKKATDAATEKTLFDFNPGTHYKIIFTKVTTPGYPNVNEAIVNEYSNVDYLITDDSNMGEVLTNGQYMLNSSNSDCKIYGDFDPAFEYPIADLLTNAPAHTKIEITPVGSGFTVATGAADINRDGQTITKLKVKFTSQFSSGSVKVRIGNLIKIFTFSIEVDPAYIKIEDVLEARIASGFESRTIALSKSPYNERIKPTDLTDKLEGLGTGEAAYIHFNKITMGDQARIGEAYFTQKSTNIHHTKVIVYQRPYINVEGIKFSTGSIVVGWTPSGELRYKIGGGAEKGILFFFASHVGLHNTDIPAAKWSTSFPIYIPTSQTANSPIETSSGYEYSQIKTIVDESNAFRTNDPCKALTSLERQWRTPFRDELLILIKNVSSLTGSPFGYHSNPYGTSFANTELFSAGSGYLGDGERGGINSHSYMWATIPVWCKYVPVSVEMMGYDNPGFIGSFAGAVRCVVDDEPRIMGPYDGGTRTLVVAKHDIVVKDWATAMGLPTEANTTLMTGTAWANMGDIYTGCNIFGKGWRVPLTGEFESIIYPNRESLAAQGGDPLIDGVYGTSVQYGPTFRYNFDTREPPKLEHTWEYYATNKTMQIRVRCVKTQ